jgi:LDH2 family malate/lactate/ureidoglycolate dehydrogenase
MSEQAMPGDISPSAELLERQLAAILTAWGMPAEHVAIAAAKMVASDLRGIDSHGVAMMPLYDRFRSSGKINVAPNIRVVAETPATALIDADAALGHIPAHRAMELAVAKAKSVGMASVAVRNTNHFGAAGLYALMAAESGFIGIATTSTWLPTIVPTFGAEPMFGTNPIAFAAPAGRNPPFVLDMATSTVAGGKVKLAILHRKPIPEGWAVDANGAPVTDPVYANEHRAFTPLGGSRLMGSHKGYGLAAMVEILSTMLPGAIYAATRGTRRPDETRLDIGHFFMAIDPAAFRGDGGFADDVDDMIDALHAVRRADAAQPVLVAGDPEQAAIAERRASGIPMPADLVAQVRALCDGCGAPFLLDGA